MVLCVCVHVCIHACMRVCVCACNDIVTVYIILWQ